MSEVLHTNTRISFCQQLSSKLSVPLFDFQCNEITMRLTGTGLRPTGRRLRRSERRLRSGLRGPGSRTPQVRSPGPRPVQTLRLLARRLWLLTWHALGLHKGLRGETEKARGLGSLSLERNPS